MNEQEIRVRITELEREIEQAHHMQDRRNNRRVNRGSPMTQEIAWRRYSRGVQERLAEISDLRRQLTSSTQHRGI